MKLRNWDLLVSSDVQYGWLQLKQEILEVRQKFVLRNTIKRNKCKLVTKKVIRCRRAKKKAWVRYTNSGKNLRL